MCREGYLLLLWGPSKSRCHPHPGPDAGAPSIQACPFSSLQHLRKVRQNPKGWNVSVATNQVLKARQGDASPMTAWHFDQPGQCLSSGRGAIRAPEKELSPSPGASLDCGMLLCGSSHSTLGSLLTHFSLRVSLNDTLGNYLVSNFRGSFEPLLSTNLQAQGADAHARIRTCLLIWKVSCHPGVLCSRFSSKFQITLSSNHKSRTSW